ncbi:hypothetical protein AGR1A_Cc40225 [Agrobacterium fabacearum CFBP 5771]|uniref:5-methylcytosine restriction system specificity protein McrC n=1 Tax=Agrobacterium tumefaciens TaxID=358 RepID=UPI0009D5F79E|nr:hypothetical protein [Agrobacterium tumefaciens]CVI17434.1 hypothetical protein AGR1A_Cc40225 [Agrobacterium fabacearum CFBP 5771]
MTGINREIIDLGERKPRLFSRDQLFDRDGRSLMLPETRALKAIELRDVADAVELRAKGLIGYLPLTPTIVLNLTPKFPIQNLWRMLELADTEYDRVLPVLRSYQRADVTPPHQLLVKGFCHYARSILSSGIARGYLQKSHHGFFQPKLNFARTASNYLSRGDELNVASDAFQFTAGLRSNEIVKSACLSFLRLMPRTDEWEADRALLADLLNALGSVRADHMRFGEQSLAFSLPHWLRDSYFGALTVYAMLLGYSRIGFAYEPHGTELPSFLFSLDAVFESYIRNIFREALKDEKIAVLDGNKSNHHRPLFLDNKTYPIQPDLIFRQKKVVLGLGEVKYKEKLDEHDRYQLISHTVASQAKVGVWISPTPPGGKSGLSYVGKISTEAKFYHYQIDVSGNLDLSANDLVEKVASLVRQPES